MKILMALMGLDIGGAETHVAELALELQRRGHEVVIASAGGAYVPMLEAGGVRCEAIPMNQRDVFQMARAYRRLERLIRTERFDLVHAHARIPAFLCGRLQKKLGFPFITTAHWVFAVTPLLRKMTDWGERTVAVSEDIRTYLMEEYQVPADQIHVTINGIDTEQFSPERQEPSLGNELGLDGGPVVCHVSRLDGDRSLTAETLIDIWPQVRRVYPAARLLIVGGGDREAVSRDKAEAVNREDPGAVILTGPRTDISALVSLGDVFVGASRAVLEAMSAGLPVLLSGNEGYMGALTPEKLPGAMETNFCYRGYPMLRGETLLEDLLDLLRRSRTDWAEMGAFGRQVVLEHYSVGRMTDDYLAAYDRLLHGKKPYRAVISGYYGYDNLGDDAILLALSRQLSNLDPPVRLTVLSREPEKTARRFGLRAVPRFSPVRVFRALRDCDFLISGGGSLLQDRTSRRSLRYYLWVMSFAQTLRKPVILLCNGVGPLDRKHSREQVRRAVERCRAVSLRDSDSLALLRDIGVVRPDITVMADPAFSLSAGGDGREQLRALGVPEDRGIIGVSLRQVRNVREDLDAFAALLDRVARDTGRSILFLVMQEPGDSQVSRAIAEKMTVPAYVAPAAEDAEAMLGLIGCMDLLISMRLHTIIFAARERVPVVGCVYDPKVEAFLKQLDMPSCGTPEALDVDRAAEAAKELLARRTEARKALDARVSAMEQEAGEIGTWLLEKLGIRN